MSVGLIGIAVVVAIVIFAIFYGFSLFMRGENGGGLIGSKAKCSLCGKLFEKSELVERAIGIEKIYFFCGDCIKGLHSEYIERISNKG